MLDILLFAPFISTLVILLLSLIHWSYQIKSTVAWIISLIGATVSTALAITLYAGSDRGVVASSIKNWVTYGDFSLSFEYYLDSWAVTIALVSSVLTLLILIYSKFYMGETSHSSVYYGMVSLFLFGMLTLTLTNNLILTFLGWEIVGICSWFLIGLYHFKGGDAAEKAILSGQKAMLVTSLADIGFILSLALIASSSFRISDLIGTNVSYLVGFGFILAAFGKSAQFPLHIWISSTDSRDIDAMQGPTTVSALIHAATMVNAGIFLIARLTTFGMDSALNQILLYVGLTTAIYAGLAALGTNDLKRILAYSTISQLGYMVVALSVPDYGNFAALWHLFNHAFFKGLLFIFAGTVIHLYHSRNIFDLKGVARSDPIIGGSMFVGLLALAGFPLFSGFFSKDYIVELMFEHQGPLEQSLILLATLLTAMYSFRIIRVFMHKDNPKNEPLPLLPKLVLITMSVLSLAAAASYYLLDGFAWTTHVPEHLMHFSAASWITLIVSLLGMFLGYYYDKWLVKLPRSLMILLEEGFFVDFILVESAVKITKGFGTLFSKLQSGSNFWNFAQFILACAIISISYYISQFGGLL